MIDKLSSNSWFDRSSPITVIWGRKWSLFLQFYCVKKLDLYLERDLPFFKSNHSMVVIDQHKAQERNAANEGGYALGHKTYSGM